jgi:error-prone DNA polymerase
MARRSTRWARGCAPTASGTSRATPSSRERWQGHEAGLAASVAIAERCAFRLDSLKPRLPHFPLPPGVSEDEYLARLVEEGAQERWGWRRTARHDQQLTHELALIAKLGLSGYFLIVWDIVRFARREGILCQGRGSAANSAVCYCLGITAVDPIKLELLFERFLSEERAEAPDIDIDFAHRERERVLQYVYARYGREHAAMVCEHITWRGRSAVRDAARVLGLLAEQAGAIAAFSDRFSARNTAAALRAGAPDATVDAATAAAAREADPFAPERADAMGPANHSKRALRDAPQHVEMKAQKAGARATTEVTNPRDVTTRRNRLPTRPATLVDAVASDLIVGTHASTLIKEARAEHRKVHAGRNSAPLDLLKSAAATQEGTRRHRRGLDAAPRHRGIHVGGFVLTASRCAPWCPSNRRAWGPHRHPVGEGRPRSGRPREDRPARPRHAHGGAGLPRCTSGARAASPSTSASSTCATRRCTTTSAPPTPWACSRWRAARR